MKRFMLTACLFLTSFPLTHASGQGPGGPGGPGGPMRPESVGPMLEQQPETAALRQTIRGLTGGYKGDDAVKTEASALSAKGSAADAAGNHAEAREEYLHAISLLLGKPWADRDRFAASLAMTPAKQISDDATPLTVSVTQTYPSSYKPSSTLVVRLLLAMQPPPGAPIELPGQPPAGPRPPALVFKQFAQFDLPNRDLLSQPLQLTPSVARFSGEYMLAADVYEGETRIDRITFPIAIVHHLGEAEATTAKRLSKVKGSEVTRQSVLYPFDLARTINTGKRPYLRYDFNAGLRRSDLLLTALEAGKDPLWRAKGRTEQAYAFTEAGEVSSFGVYAPTTWDGHTPLKLVLVLHGVNDDQNSMLDRDGGIIPAAAEKHGYLLVTPLGYRTNGRYGATNNPGQPGGPRTPAGYSPAEAQLLEFSEKDTLNVLATVEKEYPVDMTHVYLMGHSMGGAGAWYLAQKYPEKWAALVATAASGIQQPYPYDHLLGMPIICGAGTADGLLPTTRDQAAALNAHGVPAEYHEVKDATHHSIVAALLPDIFQFIDTHQKTPVK